MLTVLYLDNSGSGLVSGLTHILIFPLSGRTHSVIELTLSLPGKLLSLHKRLPGMFYFHPREDCFYLEPG